MRKIAFDNLSAWEPVDEKNLFVLGNPTTPSRKVVIDVNAAWPTRVSMMRKDDTPFHLGVVQDVATIEFFASGEVRLSFSSALPGVDDIECWLYTSERRPVSVVVPDQETYTKIWERKARDPNFERMQYIMDLNMQKRLDEMAAHFERQYGANIHTGEVVENDGQQKVEGTATGDTPDDQGSTDPAPAPEPDNGAQTAETTQTASVSRKSASTRSA